MSMNYDEFTLSSMAWACAAVLATLPARAHGGHLFVPAAFAPAGVAPAGRAWYLCEN